MTDVCESLMLIEKSIRDGILVNSPSLHYFLYILCLNYIYNLKFNGQYLKIEPCTCPKPDGYRIINPQLNRIKFKNVCSGTSTRDF